MIEISAITSGTSASSDANTNTSTSSAPSAAEQGLQQQRRARPCIRSDADERVEAR